MNRLLFLLAFTWSLHSVEVPATVVRVVGGDTVETSAGMVRLLWIDTPESRGNSHGPAMPEGKAATEYLKSTFPPNGKVILWGPGDKIEQDKFGRLLAVIQIHIALLMQSNDFDEAKAPKHVLDVNYQIILAGWSPYWRKYGQAPEKLHKAYTEAEEKAKSTKAGAWATIPQWMADKGNETTAPKGKEGK